MDGEPAYSIHLGRPMSLILAMIVDPGARRIRARILGWREPWRMMRSLAGSPEATQCIAGQGPSSG